MNVEVILCVLNFRACLIGRFQQWLNLLNFQCVLNGEYIYVSVEWRVVVGERWLESGKLTTR